METKHGAISLPFDGVLLHKPRHVRARFRLLGAADFAAVRALQEAIAREVDEAIYTPSSAENIECVLRDGIGIGCFDGEALIAFLAARVPPHIEDDAYGRLLGWDEEDVGRSVEVDDVVVAPDYRGSGLQELLLRQLEAVSVDEGYWHILTTIAPENAPSLDNAYRLRYQPEKRATLFGGVTRLILHKAIGPAQRKRALLVIDYTYDFVAPDGKLSCGKAGQAIDGAIARLVDDAVAEGDEIFVLNDIHDECDALHPENRLFPPHNLAGTAGRDLYGATRVAVEDAMAACPNRVHLLDKTRYSAFAGTHLAQLLRERRVDDLLLCGVCTDICVLHTAVSAYNEGYRVSVPRQAVASFDPDGHAYALRHLENVIGASVYNLRSEDKGCQRF